ncbi:MAG TPA: hypothetical protein VLI55_08075 [Bryobacteraceae bacterium]|nr:hypothetical protein [Bryobacteraceae bacterium]
MKLNMTHMILTAGLSALLGTASLGAQNLSEVADVPFTFHAAQQTLSAGKYQVNERTATGLFQIYSPNKESIFVGAMVPTTSDPNRPHLTFACSGGECVLSEIAMPGRETAYRLSKSQIEKNLTHKLGIAAMVSVPLKAH